MGRRRGSEGLSELLLLLLKKVWKVCSEGLRMMMKKKKKKKKVVKFED